MHNLTFDYGDSTTPIKLYNAGNRSDSDVVKSLRDAADVHKKVRKEIRGKIKPGVKYIDACNLIESSVVKLFGQDDVKAGRGFPTGFSVNNVVAHDSAIPDDTRVIKKDDIIKIDYGTHKNGYIVDSAFTLAFTPEYDNLLKATKEATWTGIKMAGPDAYIPDISKAIYETIESYEVDVNGKTKEVKAIAGLGGHNILQNQIHGGKYILSKPTYPQDYLSNKENCRMKVDEIYAIETFASTGDGTLTQSNAPISHYALKKNHATIDFKFDVTKTVYNWIKKRRGTLPFCTRWLADELGPKIGNKYKTALNELVSSGVIMAYPALEEKKGVQSSQLEHTIYLHDYGKEILSAGDDY